jgi:hypothetical protein
VTDDQFNALMHDVRKIVYSLAVIIGLLIAILGLHAAHLAGALPSGSVCAREHGRGNVEIKPPGCLEVDHQFVLGRRLHRQIARLFAFQDAVDVARSLPVELD